MYVKLQNEFKRLSVLSPNCKSRKIAHKKCAFGNFYIK